MRYTDDTNNGHNIATGMIVHKSFIHLTQAEVYRIISAFCIVVYHLSVVEVSICLSIDLGSKL